jgi:hypothetical protein
LNGGDSGLELFFEISYLVLFATCEGTSNFLKQVSQSNFTVLKIMLRKNFGEFMEFFPKGLNSFKIQTEFKCSLLRKFFNSNYVGNLNIFTKGKMFLLSLSTTM